MTDANANNQQVPGEGRLLRIISGLHAGASRELADREMILVGSGDDCDIVLADAGVAAHHALISVVDGHFHLRALDAPLKLEGRLLHPGDPVEMDRLQRIGVGEAALAFGHEDDPAWLALAPEGGAFPPAGRVRPDRIPFTRRLPMIAAIAVLCLASLAIFAAVMPGTEPALDPEARLKALSQQFGVSGRSISRDVNDRWVLAGMVRDDEVRRQAQERIDSDGYGDMVRLKLTTGADLAGNVAEILRSGGYDARVRYLDRGEVEVTGSFDDEVAFWKFVETDAMTATGVREIELINESRHVPDEVAHEEQEQVRIVAYDREGQYVLDEHGRRYGGGEYVPGWGILGAMGKYAQAIGADDVPRRIDVRPITAEEKAPKAGAALDAGSGDERAPASPRSRAYAAEQARAASQRQ